MAMKTMKQRALRFPETHNSDAARQRSQLESLNDIEPESLDKAM